MILQLLLRPTLTGARIEQTDELVPSVFREALSVTVTVGYHRLARGNENPILMWIPLGVLARWCYWLGHAGKRKAEPGSMEGGLQGIATDGVPLYTNIVNGNNLPFTLQPSTRTSSTGGWVPWDANTREILWTMPNLSNDTAHGLETIMN
ncbi:Hypothetical predicted protein [Olea europaea subsp. europaea]|uniref:Uncharacterized protein n=1 Tax=Olea europaea subsp. europaea TaxID=158383 RepID=A0A8S0SRK4_OLEEU|nr:Hypothetical predicted protein [Olea europaea subsp. europaea]